MFSWQCDRNPPTKKWGPCPLFLNPGVRFATVWANWLEVILCDIWQPDIKLPSFQFCSFGLLASQSQHLCWEEAHTSLCQETPWRDHVQMFWLPVQRRSQSTVSTSHKTTRQLSEDILQTPPLNHAQTSGLPPWGPKHCGAETTFSHCARHKSPCHRICERNRMVVFMLLSFGVIYFTSGVCAWLSSFSQPWF